MEHLQNFLQLFRIMPAATDPIHFLISAHNIRIFPQCACNFVQFLNNFSRHLQHQGAKGPRPYISLRMSAGFQFSSSVMIANGSPAGEKARQKRGMGAGTTFFCLLYGTPLSGHYFFSSHIWTNLKNKWVNRWVAFYPLFKNLKMSLSIKCNAVL